MSKRGAYEGSLGKTTATRVLVRCPSGVQVAGEVYVGVDAATDRDLAEQLISAEPTRALNHVRCPETGEYFHVQIPVCYHDPDNLIFVLVLFDAHRHREFEERSALIARIGQDGTTVPSYITSFDLVWGREGLRTFLTERAEQVAAEALGQEKKDREAAELERRAEELTRKEHQLVSMKAEMDLMTAELERQREDLDAREASPPESERPRPVIEVIDSDEADAGDGDDESRSTLKMATAPANLLDEPELTEPSAPDASVETSAARLAPPHNTGPSGLAAEHPDEVSEVSLVEEIEPELFDEHDVVVADQLVDDNVRSTAQSDGAEGATVVGSTHDVAIERWIVSKEPTLKSLDERGNVRFAVSGDSSTLEELLGDQLKLMLQLHQLEHYPLISLSIGEPATFDQGSTRTSTLLVFDIKDKQDRAVLDALARDFTFGLELFDTEYIGVRKRTVSAGLSGNVPYLIAAADEHWHKIDEDDRNLNKAILAHSDPTYDRFGHNHPERREFRDGWLTDLTSAQNVRRAIHVARRFSSPDGESYLFLTRGYPHSLWQKRRREVLERAIDIGLWIGSTLAQAAVSEGLARSRKDLAMRLQKNFQATDANPTGHDLDGDAVRDNWTALAAELSSLGVDPASLIAPKTEPIDSDGAPEASGTIGAGAGAPASTQAQGGIGRVDARSTDTLVNMLDDKDRRLDIALELCRRGNAASVRPVFASLRRMTRGEAGRVLGSAVGFGAAAVPLLLETLGSRKGFLRQGAALALGVLGPEEGIEAISDLLISEPTDIWKEVARALGESGERAIGPVVARTKGQPARILERVAWALAHIASRGYRDHVERLSKSQDKAIAGVARHGLELARLAKNDHDLVRGERAPRDQTVKRAFSRRFFEAMPMAPAEGTPAAVPGSEDLSGPAMVLDESDLIEADDLGGAKSNTLRGLGLKQP